MLASLVARPSHLLDVELIDKDLDGVALNSSPIELARSISKNQTFGQHTQDMNSPRLLRPLRPLLHAQLTVSTPRTAQIPFLRPTTTQLRTNASIASEPPSSAPSPTPVSKASTPMRKAAKKVVQKKKTAVAKKEENENDGPRMPRSLEALYLKPLRRVAQYGVPSCDLQLRSYSVRNLEFFADFALRAAYYLGLPAYGPVPLPRMTERWTVPKSSFIFKKSQENFERITLRRLIQIRDGHPESVQAWLAFLQKHQYYGVGMKANMWEFSKLDVAKTMDESVAEVSTLLEDKWNHLGHDKDMKGVKDIEEFLATERLKASGGR